LAAQLIRGVFHLDICWFRVIGALFWFFGILKAEQVDGVGDKQSADTKTVYVTAILEAFFEHAPKIWLFHCWSFFLINSTWC
jgi:hypothetical protein